ncbi:hypothetical protein BO86DRAFT_29301 [Aspergillus japonicus CBS 114.51]|uniref:Uncharacterized protein n=1 Tax=Aspergillus japonicus CBS 114.51 TaxID=1448312 RepID=A0A8T8WKB3_ASPJA|nr:hypothetical protein BO86DRAFT_29301 [Aspergillus japonicus CBS 114.51]RAH76132.1 hypothetical protein BO86DRAFT_29301 [Aspergillus japonicus CBS 114.51]
MLTHIKRLANLIMKMRILFDTPPSWPPLYLFLPHDVIQYQHCENLRELTRKKISLHGACICRGCQLHDRPLQGDTRILQICSDPLSSILFKAGQPTQWHHTPRTDMRVLIGHSSEEPWPDQCGALDMLMCRLLHPPLAMRVPLQHHHRH